MSSPPPLPVYTDTGRAPSEHLRLPVLLLILGVLVAAVAVWVPAPSSARAPSAATRSRATPS